MSRFTHGLTRHPLYQIWSCMKNRCDCSTNTAYYRYGGRGIKVCKRWYVFQNFYDDVIAGYKKGLLMDRIDNDGDYTPKNIRWVTHAESDRNKSSNNNLTLHGVTMCIEDWAKKLGITPPALRCRLNRCNMTFEQALTIPKLSKKTNKKYYTSFLPTV